MVTDIKIIEIIDTMHLLMEIHKTTHKRVMAYTHKLNLNLTVLLYLTMEMQSTKDRL